ncbi:MAG: type IV pilus assembly protein PilM [Desulfobacterales bacterium]|uniref:Type IV pilus assembly protein PilM n=1 Tax=Candidatus Desulfaltia bathyphila TaxID=2841697 RepID=A0A8J6N8Y9_9BACT|nr:type IV pilus assembly protein PilM [Candidatus Desulfaltia bathyphila]MBL7195668.1 type IV pilus assembly protein PilM [Desulfobacterales bacterium]MBL7207141.1 type IV pilus assembly protein PilM [Desulfobacterales bacterium]
MLFKKTSHLVGLDIGSGALKASEIVETKSGHCLQHFGMLDIAHGAIEEGVIKDADEIAASIRKLFNENSFKTQNVAISIGGYSVIVKKISVQTMTEEQFQGVINSEAEQYIPFDISEVNLDYQILGETENNPNQMDVLLVAAKKEVVDSYVNLIQMAGLNPCVIDIDTFALQNIFELNYAPEDENIALIDIGAGKTSLNILKGNSSLFMRDVTLGCGMINREIVSLINCSYEEAEQLKYGDQPDKISHDDLKEIISSVVDDWCNEIRRALDFFYSAYPDDQIKRIILSGGGAYIKEFRELLAIETSSEVEIINPFKNIQIDKKSFDISYLERIAPQAAISMGLSIRKIDDK